MSFEVRTIAPFDRQVKRLSKKYPSLKSDLAQFALSLRTDPRQGTALGRDTFKVRLAITSKGRRRSGGARVITHLVLRHKNVYLIAVYDKSEQATVTDAEIRELVGQIPE